MASKVVVTKNKLNAIGDAIREKTGSNEKYTLDKMPMTISTLNNSSNGITLTVTTHNEELFNKNITLTINNKSLTNKFSEEGNVSLIISILMEQLFYLLLTRV